MEPDAKNEIRGGTETILLVEDTPAVRVMIQAALEHYGYKVLEADSPLAALEIWNEKKDQINLVLTDVDMPEISGIELVKKIQKEKPLVRAIYMSGYNAEMIQKDFELRDGVNFLQKPYLPKKLAQTVRAALDQIN